MEKSYLFVPGNHPERILKALSSEADAVIIDLEDSIPPTKKEVSRNIIAKKMKQINKTKKSIFIRINDLGSDYWRKDIEIVEKFPDLGIMLPKSESREDIEKVNDYLTTKQPIIPLIETAKGVMSAQEISASATNIRRLAFGAIDYCLELGIAITSTGEELNYPRSLLVLASKASGIDSPIDTVYTDIKNKEGLMNDIKRAKQLGFFAKLCIHPAQLKKVNQFFMPTEKEVNWAKEVIKVFKDAERKGKAAINLNGEMIDYPVYKKACFIMRRNK